MKLIDKLVDTISSKLILIYKYNLQADPLKINTEYINRLDLIKSLYSDAYYWHGTGRYHYQHMGDSKYHSKVSDHIFDVLQSIIQQGGLTPQYDFWTQMASISITKNRIYARAYAQFHLNENTPLQYEYGTTKFWFYVLGIKQIFTNNFSHNIRRIKNMHMSKDFNNRFKQWAKYVRKDMTRQPISLFSFYKLRSDIIGNYGILFGIKRSSVREVKYNSTIERYEVRSVEPINFIHMTHLEVPLTHVEEVEKILKRNNIDLPVLPIEFTEIYCNSMKFEKFSK